MFKHKQLDTIDASVNPFAMKKHELVVFLTQRCEHGHIYREHPACYIKEQNRELRIGYLDIETSNLAANFGIMLSYAIKVRGQNAIYCGTISRDDLSSGDLDKNLVSQCIEDMNRFDVVITYYGTKFDVPFIRTRAMYYALDFPKFGYLKHKDVYYMVKAKMRLHSNRLESVCRLLNIKGKTHIENEYWIKALTGDKKSLKYILDHNKNDVIILEKVHDRIRGYVQDTTKSV